MRETFLSSMVVSAKEKNKAGKGDEESQDLQFYMGGQISSPEMTFE